MNQDPFQNVIHERPGGIGGDDIADDERPPGQQQLVGPINQIHHKRVVQVIGQPHTVDQRLWL
jgi:hypothetical protein